MTLIIVKFTCPDCAVEHVKFVGAECTVAFDVPDMYCARCATPVKMTKELVRKITDTQLTEARAIVAANSNKDIKTELDKL